MISKYHRKTLPSIRHGIFDYVKPQVPGTVKEIADIASKYSFSLGSPKVEALNYLFSNHFITLAQAEMLAKQLVSWKGTHERRESLWFSDDHKRALIALVQDYPIRQIPIEEVVNNLQGLNSDHATRIANGLTREEAMTNLPYSDDDQSFKLNP